jgi:hypothetical protein
MVPLIGNAIRWIAYGQELDTLRSLAERVIASSPEDYKNSTVLGREYGRLFAHGIFVPYLSFSHTKN